MKASGMCLAVGERHDCDEYQCYILLCTVCTYICIKEFTISSLVLHCNQPCRYAYIDNLMLSHPHNITMLFCILYIQLSTPPFNNIPHHLRNHAIFNVRVKEHPLTVLIWLNRLGFDNVHIVAKHCYMNANGIFFWFFFFLFFFYFSFTSFIVEVLLQRFIYFVR